jgi:hypothetical protein
MKTFKRYIKEENAPRFGTSSGITDVNDGAVRDNINTILTMTTARKYITPYLALERVKKALANFHIFLPNYSFLEGDSGMAVFDVKQFGDKMGMTDDGQFIKEVPPIYHVYFEYQLSDCGMFEAFCEVVSKAELDEILKDVEDEMNEAESEELEEEAHTAEPETGERKTPGSNQEPFEKASAPKPIKKRTDAEMEKKKLDEVVTARKMTSKEKKARAEYIVKHKEKLAAFDTGIKAKKTVKDVKSEPGDYGSEPSKMGLRNAIGAGYYKVDESMEEKKEKKKAKFKAYRDERDESKKKREDMKWQKHRLTKEGIDLSKIKLNKDTGNISSSDPKANLSKVKMDKKTGNISAINEISKKLAARYNNKVSREISKNQNSGGDPDKIRKRENREAGNKLSWNKYHGYKVKVSATNEDRMDDLADTLKTNRERQNAATDPQEKERLSGQRDRMMSLADRIPSQPAINELTAKLVGKVNKARAVGGKPSKTKTASATLSRAVAKKWLDSDVGKLKQ